MYRKFIFVFLILSITSLIGCAGVTEFDKYISNSYSAILEKNRTCLTNANYSQSVSCAKSQLAEMQASPDSYIKPAIVKYAKSYLKLATDSYKMSKGQVQAELEYITKVRDDDLLYAAKAERSQRNSEFMQRLGAAGKAYNESMRQAQPQSPTRCNSQPDGMGGFTTLCR